jgi:hypothetical protein
MFFSVLKIYFLGDTIKIERGIACVTGDDLFSLATYTIDSLIRHLLSFSATPTHKKFDEPGVDYLVLLARLFPVRMKPLKQTVEVFLI